MAGATSQSVNCAGFTGTLTGSAGMSIRASFTLAATMAAYTYTGLLNWTSTQTTGVLTSAGFKIAAVTVAFTADTGKLTLGDDLLCDESISSSNLTLSRGIFNAAGFNVTRTRFATSTASNKTLQMGGGLWTLRGTSTVWDLTTGAGVLTLTVSTSNIKITNSTNTAVTFAGNGNTYNNLWFSRGASTATNTITGSNTFIDFKDDGTAAHTDTFTSSTTQTVKTFHVTGTSGNLITINAVTSGTFWTLSCATGIICCDWLSVKDVHGSGGAVFNMGANSTNVSGNAGLNFVGCGNFFDFF